MNLSFQFASEVFNDAWRWILSGVWENGISLFEHAIEHTEGNFVAHNNLGLALAGQGKNPFQLDSRAPNLSLKEYIYNETRYTMLAKSNPEEAKRLLELAQEDVASRWKLYEHMSHQEVKQ